MDRDPGQQHPIGLYLKVWGLLFVLSFFSYMVDYHEVQGHLRWILVVTFMLLKAGLIVAVFMHLRWERLALIAAITLPPLAVVVLAVLMAVEGDYTAAIRDAFFATPAP